LRATYDEFERAMDRDRFMIAEEALEWGLVDRILQVGDDSTDQVGAT
jgi:ATP-dependent Clp protease protease subunit